MHTVPEILQRLLAGNEKYISSFSPYGNISHRIRIRTAREGQFPYAIVIACSDSRVIPEAIFSCGIDELFTIRVAGNVLDQHQLGSVEYAAAHLGSKLVLVMGHTHCGAVSAAISGDAHGYIRSITDIIQEAIGNEKDKYHASCLNVKHSVEQLRQVFGDDEELRDLVIQGAMYDIETGKVELI